MKFTKKQWIKGGIIIALYLLFTIWTESFWPLILLPFIIDIYFTKKIPWTWWKKSKNPMVKRVMEWVDAILFALIAVYFINTFFFQNYQIPTSSLEKTLLVGDYLFVSKCNYGSRIPNTPLAFPLAQHTLPILNTKSYIENPQWEYKRLKGFEKVERGNIVVFNFPAGDTVALKQQNPDYYTLCSLYGRERVWTDKATFGEIVWRPIDRRENYVKRCVGIAGDTLQIINNDVYIDGVKQARPKEMQLNYYIVTDGTQFTDMQFRKLGVSVEDRSFVRDPNLLAYLNIPQNTVVYDLPLTSEALALIKQFSFVKNVVVQPGFINGSTYPLTPDNTWTIDNYGPIWIPKKGATIKLTEANYPVYERVIRTYEDNQLEKRNGKYIINGIETDEYTFKMDYFWMMGDNRMNSADSRSWGFVPEDHVVGKPIFIWMSLDKDRGWFDGKIRFNRLFKLVPSN
ncbi:MAG: signal peptidase I [Bacteroidales bacterium]